MLNLHVVSYSSYSEKNSLLEGGAIAAFNDLTDAQQAMSQNFNETLSFYKENEIKNIEVTEDTATIVTKEGYKIIYTIDTIGNPTVF